MLNKINISPKEQILIIYVVLAAITLAVFWQVNQFDFVFDDVAYVTQNSHIQTGITLDGFRWAFSTRYANLWNPMIWLSLMFDYQLFGLNAGGYHMTNLILHILSTLLLFWLFKRMTGAIWRSAFVAALFALHPLHVESVAYIAERKDVLSAFFWMLTLCLYVYYTEKPVVIRYLLVLSSFVLALLSKPMVVTLPLIMILLDYWPLGRFDLKQRNFILWQLKEKILFFVLSAVIVIITLYNPNTPDTLDNPDSRQFSLISRLANAPISFMTYLEKTFWPHDMAVFYPFSEQLPVWQLLGASLFVILISAAVIAAMKRLPYLFVGWMWYAITITPVIGIIQISLTTPYAMADRYHYLPSIGITMMLAWGIPSLIKSENIRKKSLFPAVTVTLIIIAVLTWHQCRYWGNSITLWKHALDVTKDSHLVHYNLATALITEGKNEEAIDNLNKVICLKPDYVAAYNNRGSAYFNLGQYQPAIDDYNKAINLKPDYADAYNNRGSAYFKLGQHQNAIDDYNKAIYLKPDYADAYNNRGSAYFKLGQHQSAIEDYNKVINLKPDYADAYRNRGFTYLMQGNNEPGCRDAQKACELGNCKFIEEAKGRGYCR